MDLNLTDRVALITGGANGIGLACAEAFVAEGARVFCVDIDQAALDQLPASVTGVRKDMASPDECCEAVALVLEKAGRVDVLVNNVGIEPNEGRRRLHESTAGMWDRIMGVNAKSYYLMMAEVLPHMMQQRAGVIINVASVQSLLSERSGIPAYGASKGAILPLTRIAALDYAEYNIRVLTVCPGAIETPLVKAELDAEGIRKLGKLHPVGRIGKPEEVADVVCFLSSERAAFMTGSVVCVDGGLMAKGAWDRENL